LAVCVRYARAFLKTLSDALPRPCRKLLLFRAHIVRMSTIRFPFCYLCSPVWCSGGIRYKAKVYLDSRIRLLGMDAYSLSCGFGGRGA